MATSDTFPAEEFGSGSRVTLTPYDHAFLESPPTYEEGGSLLPPEPVLPAPSTKRRVLSLLLFVFIASGASAVLGLALLRALGRALPW